MEKKKNIPIITVGAPHHEHLSETEREAIKIMGDSYYDVDNSDGACAQKGIDNLADMIRLHNKYLKDIDYVLGTFKKRIQKLESKDRF